MHVTKTKNVNGIRRKKKSARTFGIESSYMLHLYTQLHLYMMAIVRTEVRKVQSKNLIYREFQFLSISHYVIDDEFRIFV